MSNDEIVIKLMERYGADSALLFCRMNSYVHHLEWEDRKNNNLDDPCDHEYQWTWWRDKYIELFNTYGGNLNE